MANAGFVNLKQVDRSWLVELKEPDVSATRTAQRTHGGPPSRREVSIPVPQVQSAAGAEVAPPLHPEETHPEEAPGPSQTKPKAEAPTPAAEAVRSEQAIALLRKIFANGKSNVRWPMYLRSFKQLLRSEEPAFEEQAFGFASVYDLVRQAQREGLLRIERNRKGILRIFPGEHFPQAVPQEPVQQGQPATPAQAPIEPGPVEVSVEEALPEMLPEVSSEPVRCRPFGAQSRNNRANPKPPALEKARPRGNPGREKPPHRAGPEQNGPRKRHKAVYDKPPRKKSAVGSKNALLLPAFLSPFQGSHSLIPRTPGSRTRPGLFSARPSRGLTRC